MFCSFFLCLLPPCIRRSHVGETPQKTGAVIENCRGKVLLIDEAYALNDAHHGREALDTLVGKVGRRM